MILAMAASPALHKAIHHDADDDDHDCAATLVVHGVVDDWGMAPLLEKIELLPIPFLLVAPFDEVVPKRLEGRLSTRGPPVE